MYNCCPKCGNTEINSALSESYYFCKQCLWIGSKFEITRSGYKTNGDY